MKLAIIYGSSSNEHEVSIISAYSIIKSLNYKKYQVTPIYLNKQNEFYYDLTDIQNHELPKVGFIPEKLEYIKEPFTVLKDFNIVFNMVHGKNGEDGILASIFEFLSIPYVGNTPLSSMLTMDKILTKNELERVGIKTAPYIPIIKYNEEYIINGEDYSYLNLIDKIIENMSFPFYIKPARSGSSIGISKVTTKSELDEALELAFNIDNRILIEEEIKGQECECAILEDNGKLIASTLGEVIVPDKFYSFDAKYKNHDSKTIIPANIPNDIQKKIQEEAKKAFKCLDLHEYSRIDFFLTDKNEIILNEINTIPGFTEISMYPKLLEYDGYKRSEILDILINNAYKKRRN